MRIICVVTGILFFIVNMGVLFAIGWGVIYPDHEIVIMFHTIMMILGFCFIGYSLDCID